MYLDLLRKHQINHKKDRPWKNICNKYSKQLVNIPNISPNNHCLKDNREVEKDVKCEQSIYLKKTQKLHCQ